MSEEQLLSGVRELMTLYAFSSMTEDEMVERLFDLFKEDQKSLNYHGLEEHGNR